ncbi:ankyrin repeat domain-containing protein 13C-B-like [Dorcoceras hygrometricum]|uniref:Ankyrin repeat domain-containing protein 13C-B-like n=1 Tax=Dorcoceras hygrometricum TaxID=472368 RepID=A0A2Z7BY60_9LAMI|nr:ankyrin repeat domain-containing protein 13C-B-like [Dorcoceras hygrometricum]
MSKSAATAAVIRPQDYAGSPVHYAVAVGDHVTLNKLLSSIPRLPDPSTIRTESDSVSQERLADKISSALDRRDNRLRETPLHLAVRLNDVTSARALATAGADISLQNAAGWNPLQEALLQRSADIVSVLVQRHHLAAWSKWRRRLPSVVAALRRMRDFYMEISFHFESSIVPFVGKIAPSDTYKIWKREGNLRADTSLAGYDGLKIQRANQSFLFLNDSYDDRALDIPPGSLFILNHDEKKIYDAFENAGNPLSDSDISNFCNQTSVYRPGMDVTKAELIARTNWRRQEKTENVGEWKARVYEMHNVIFTFRSRKACPGGSREDPFGPTCVLPLEIDEESDDGFIVAENPRFSVSNDRQRRHSSFVREDREFVTVSRKSVDIIPIDSRRRAPPSAVDRVVAPPDTKEKEYAKNLRPTFWLTEQFPLKTEELLPLLDILAHKVKAVRRMREILTTTFPPGTFPVKVAIPVVPTVKVVITFTKFIDLQPVEHFYTPLSSPRQFSGGSSGGGEEAGRTSGYLSSWLSRSGSRQQASGGEHVADPFAIPSGYSWSSFDDKNRKMSKSKSSRRTK